MLSFSFCFVTTSHLTTPFSVEAGSTTTGAMSSERYITHRSFLGSGMATSNNYEVITYYCVGFGDTGFL